jgi:cytochrome c-type biogenesis protein CcmF
MESGALFHPISREGGLVLNNLFLSVAALAVLIGTLYPLLLEALTGAKISVGPPFFNLTAVPLMVPLFLAIPFGQRLAWKRGDLYGVAQRFWVASALALFIGAVVAYLAGGGPVLALLGITLGLFLTLGSLDEIRERAMRGGREGALRRLVGLPRSFIAMALAHAGAGIMVIGISATAFEKEQLATLQPGQSVRLGQYLVQLRKIEPYAGPNYNATAAHFIIRDHTGVVGELAPAKRVYIGRQMPTSEVGRLNLGLSEIYLAIGETSTGDRVDLRAYWKPYVLLIWLGPLLMTLAGLLSLTDRRYRVGAPQRAKRQPNAVPEPAE